MKPNRFHTKLFQVCEASSGYVLAFDIYSGKKGCDIVDKCKVLDNLQQKLLWPVIFK